ncbi:acyl carrier protein [Phaeobacter sp. C3_T13_0]|uniref:acyl carrier protein n=1 Tax=Phaeobacter cretensis TaxID=3342641 RepID=UPI0039BD09F2
MQNIEQIITDALIELLDMPDNSQISVKSRLQEDLGVDSGLLLELFMAVEESLPQAVLDPAVMKPDDITTVGSFVEMVRDSMVEEEPA